MTTHGHISCFSKLGKFFAEIAGFPATGNFIENEITAFRKIIQETEINNPWFTEKNIYFSLKHWAEMLKEENLAHWVNNYDQSGFGKLKKIGVIMAGNIPMVGFHDMLAVLISGNIFIGKLSSRDDLLLKAISETLIRWDNGYQKLIFFEDNKLAGIDAVIATGSNNTARYFEYYFGRYPRIIRKNRNSTAILTGNETPGEIALLSDDIFLYFGLGCRNVSKIFFPENYLFENFFQPLEHWKHIAGHNKYMNNYEYNRTIYLMNNEKHLDNGFLLLKEDQSVSSPIAVMFYEYYRNLDKLKERINFDLEKIQCVVSNMPDNKNYIKFGASQLPELWDYADNIDTLEFLTGL